MLSKQSFHPKLLQSTHRSTARNNKTMTQESVIPHSVNLTGPGDYDEHIQFGHKVADSKRTNFPAFSIGKAEKLKLFVFDRT